MTSKELQKMLAEEIDLYKVLHSTIDDEPSQLKAQYMQLVLAYHPDKLPPESSTSERKESEEKFHLLQKAYGVLQDQASKRVYDNWYRKNSEKIGINSNSNSNSFARTTNRQIKLQEYGVYLRKLQHFDVPLENAVSFEKFSSANAKFKNSGSEASFSKRNQPHESAKSCLNDSNLVESKQLYVRVDTGVAESLLSQANNTDDIELIKNNFTNIATIEPLSGKDFSSTHEYIVEFHTFLDTLHNLNTASENSSCANLVVKPKCFVNGTYHFGLSGK
ncbi:hypothetical protein ACO0RG_001716 [Hanseniaspora osmophila]